MNGVNVRDVDNIERALRKFKRVCESAGVLSEVRKVSHYEKPCDERRRKKKAAIRKQKMRELEATQPHRRKRRKRR